MSPNRFCSISGILGVCLLPACRYLVLALDSLLASWSFHFEVWSMPSLCFVFCVLSSSMLSSWKALLIDHGKFALCLITFMRLLELRYMEGVSFVEHCFCSF